MLRGSLLGRANGDEPGRRPVPLVLALAALSEAFLWSAQGYSPQPGAQSLLLRESVGYEP